MNSTVARSLRLVPFAVVLTALSAAPAAASPAPNARMLSRQASAQGVRVRADRVTGLLGRTRIRAVAQRPSLWSRASTLLNRLVGRAQSQGTAAAPSSHLRRYVGNGYRTDLTQMLDHLDVIASDVGVTPQERLRTAGAVARAMLTVERDFPGTHSVVELDRMQRSLADARVAQRTGSHETAVEMELIGMTDGLLNAMTTHDGTLGPIFRESRQAPPAWLVERARGGDVHAMAWDDLPRGDKLKLLVSQSQGRDFFRNRRIPGIRLRPTIRVSGRHPRSVSTAGLVPEYVEYQGPAAVDNVGGAEVHVRQAGAASRTLLAANGIRTAMGYENRSTHQHVTTSISPELERGDADERVGLVDFYRRVNVVAEMREALQGRALRQVRQGTITYRDYLEAGNLAVLNEHLSTFSTGQASPIHRHSQLKMAAVGFRPAELYDGGPKTIGFELRGLSTASASENAPLVDAVQRGLIGRHYGRTRTQYAQWRRTVSGNLRGRDAVVAEGRALSEMHYNQPIAELLRVAPAELVIDAATRESLSREASTHYGVKMLVFDWARDPVVAADPQLLASVRTAQQRALGAYARNRTSDGAVAAVQRFIADSGLFERYSESIGLEP